MKFLLDMGISPKSAAFLRELDHEATHLHQQRLGKLPDPDILSKARDEEAVLVTHDLDFPDLLASTGAKLPSVVLFRLRNMRPENVNRHLRLVLVHHEPALHEGAILTVTEGRIRQRMLPIEQDSE